MPRSDRKLRLRSTCQRFRSTSVERQDIVQIVACTPFPVRTSPKLTAKEHTYGKRWIRYIRLHITKTSRYLQACRFLYYKYKPFKDIWILSMKNYHQSLLPNLLCSTWRRRRKNFSTISSMWIRTLCIVCRVCRYRQNIVIQLAG